MAHTYTERTRKALIQTAIAFFKEYQIGLNGFTLNLAENNSYFVLGLAIYTLNHKEYVYAFRSLTEEPQNEFWEFLDNLFS